MDRNLWVVIPVGPRLIYIDEVIANLGLPQERVIVVKERFTRDIHGATNLHRPDVLNIQLWWRIGIDFAKHKGARWVAILSDDIKINPNQLNIMLEELKTQNASMIASRTSKKYGWGHAFILDVESGNLPDTRFCWYFGDWDLKYQAQRKRGFITSSQEIEHLLPGDLTRNSSDFQEIIIRDRLMFRRKYPFKTTCVWVLNKVIKASSLFTGALSEYNRHQR